MTKNKLFLAAIGNENFQQSLKEILFSLNVQAGDITTPPKIVNKELEKNLLSAEIFARAHGLNLRSEQILDQVKRATGDDLDIILGRYTGEIPVSAEFN